MKVATPLKTPHGANSSGLWDSNMPSPERRRRRRRSSSSPTQHLGILSEDSSTIPPLEVRGRKEPIRLSPSHTPRRGILKPINTTNKTLEILRAGYSDEIPNEDLFCTHRALEMLGGSASSYKDKKFLINAHITKATLPLLEDIIKLGATLHVTSAPDLNAHSEIEDIILAAGLNYYPEGNIPAPQGNGFYDLVFDCGAGMLDKITPKIGMIELTHTDPQLYKNKNETFITIDTSISKEVETSGGTGGGAVRAYEAHAKRMIAEMISQLFQNYQTLKTLEKQLPHSENRKSEEGDQKIVGLLSLLLSTMNSKASFDNEIVIFGCGKVGSGIAKAFVANGTPPGKIHIVDVSLEAFSKARVEGYNIHHIDRDNLKESIAKIKKVLPKMHCAITATGVEGVISDQLGLTVEDFRGVPVLMNMGTPDEWGKNFPKDRVVNEKRPANFALKYPTEMPYLDIIWMLLLLSGDELLRNHQEMKHGLHDVSKKSDAQALSAWTDYYGKRLRGSMPDGITEAKEKIKTLLAGKVPQTKEEVTTLLIQSGLMQAKPPRPVTPHSCLSPTSKATHTKNPSLPGLSGRFSST